ncbi:hypothetical protein ACIBHY_27730 [Nonomuraea sp. NPDC050547]|uniref:hypothetical protein n=1 Tax=Nonomuraea sp. NPDC050547 TaxID=3364368 RepID=UPI0037877963
MAKLLERPAVASPPPLPAKYRAACQLFPDDRGELIHGRIVVNDVPTWKHNKIVSRLLKQIVAKADVHDDYAIKPKEYAIAGVQAFLRIDPMEATAGLHSGPAPDGYTIVVNVALGNPLEMPAPWNLTLDTAQLNVAESSG